MSVNVLVDYLHSAFLVRLWMSYMIPMITISHIAITSSSFLILAATVERYCITTNSRRLPLVQRNRKLIAFCAILFGIISKGTMFFEFNISVSPECAGLVTELGIGFANFVFDTPYHTVWRFWYRNFVTVFFPFFILAYFQIRIVKALSHQQKQSCADLINNTLEVSKRKKTTRSATRTMILVVCCYLISNIMNVLLTIWEHVDKTSLAEKYDGFYAIALDFVSLATNLSCAFRVPIYLACQAPLRNEFFYTLKHWIRCESAEHRTNNTSPQTPASPENICLINGHATESSITSDPIQNGSRARSLSFNDNDTVSYRTPIKSDKALVSNFHEDQLSTSSSITAQHEIFKRLFWGSHNETLL
uniref:G-protein coupled receptors family 1 profile domain-containing protein n=1 Tax=Panagrolaimus superbus TaxID=310955 RepID=A0A914Y4R6_9BILA